MLTPGGGRSGWVFVSSETIARASAAIDTKGSPRWRRRCIGIDNQVLTRRPAAARAKSRPCFPRTFLIWARDPMSVDLKAVPLDARDVAETDDRVAIWQGKLESGRRAARYDQSDFGDRYCRDGSGQSTEGPLASNSTGEDQRERGPADDGLAEVPDFPGDEFPAIAGNTGKAATNRSTIALGTNLQGLQIARIDSTRPAIGQK